jgi:proteasome alpha subunit
MDIDDDLSYDEDVTIFSPQGHLYQVEYARESVKKGTTTIGIKFKDGVILLALKNIGSKLIEYSVMDKIKKIDTYISCTFCGLSADARNLIDFAQEEVQINKVLYGDDIHIKFLVDKLCEYMNVYSRFEIVRPFGVVLFIGGVDEKGPHLFVTDPSGAYLEYKAICEGKKKNAVTKYLEKYYKENMNTETAIKLVIQAIKKSTKKKIESKYIELGIVTKNKPFEKLSTKDIDNYIKKV